MRLISSGMLRSKLRSPASTWATGISSLAAVSAQASVEFTSPATTTTIGLDLEAHRLEAFHGLRGLHGVAAAADLQAEVGPRHAELAQEHVAHRVVVVLSRVDQPRPKGGVVVASPATAAPFS